ncbi:MAG: helix-turn-helix domain-containing protein [Gammaproteobacteria bacterium]|nr:helix-turn-helix domain-containing protein [Gammaproteobacteria bacterium]
MGKSILLNTKQVAERIGLSVSQVRRMAKSGLIKASKVGTEYVIYESDLKNIKRKRSLKKLDHSE